MDKNITLISKCVDEITKLKEKRKQCNKCNLEWKNPKKIKLCGHIYCETCISDISKCSKCDIEFTDEDLTNDPSINNFIQELTTLNDSCKNLIGNRCKRSSILTICSNLSKEKNCEDSSLLSADYNLKCDCDKYISYFYNRMISEVIDKKNAVGETKLHQACKKGNEKEVEALLASGIEVNVQDYAGWTPLHEAVINGKINIIKSLLNHGSVVNVPGDFYETPLHKAVEKNNSEVVKLLTKHGANIDSRNYEGISPWDVGNKDLKFIMTSTPSSNINTIDRSNNIKQINIYIIDVAGKKTSDFEEVLKSFKTLTYVKILNELDKTVTHAVVNTTSKLVVPTFEFMFAILMNIPVVTMEWLMACKIYQKMIDCSEYFVIGTEEFTYTPVFRSFYNGRKLHPKLFNGCSFYLSKIKQNCRFFESSFITRDQIVELLKIGGAKILKREPNLSAISQYVNFPWHSERGSSVEQCCHFIIYDPDDALELKYNMRELKHMPYHWIFDSILKYKLTNLEINS